MERNIACDENYFDEKFMKLSLYTLYIYKLRLKRVIPTVVDSKKKIKKIKQQLKSKTFVS